MRLRRIALVLTVALAATAYPEFTDWSSPTNLGPPVNTTDVEQAPFLSKRGLSLYFGRVSADGFGGLDIWVSQRASTNSHWETPENLGPSVNTAAIENGPALSLDEHSLYFNSNRSGGFGGNDLYVSRRHNKRDPLGWESPVNLGSNINSSAEDTSPTFFEDEATGIITMYLDSNRPGKGDSDIYASTILPDGTFTPAVLVEELSSSFSDRGPVVRRDGLEVFLQSDRPGPGRVGQIDLMVSTRATTSDPWSTPVYLGSIVNSPFIDGAPALSFDGTALYFHSTRNSPDATGPCLPNLGPCVFDLYVAARAKLKEPDD
jgi:Tol biopolymer transport system component